MNIFFDLDGTLIDARQRLYGLFKALVKECDLSFDSYWEIKRKQLDHQHILRTNYSYTEDQIDKFVAEWMKKIEEEEWLLMDQPLQDVETYLEKLSKIADLYVITARQKPEMAIKQISNLGWDKYFKAILVTMQEGEKDEVIRSAVNINEGDFIVGDTGKDIQAGQLLGIRTIGVLSGFRNRESLMKYNPDFIVDTITDFNFEPYLVNSK